MKKLKAAIIGYGRNGSYMHAEPFEKMTGELELVAVCDTDAAACAAGKERFKCKAYSSYKEMLKAEKLDFVVIVTRSDQHCEMTCDCLKAGVDVLVTKPWATNAKEAEKMIACAKESGKKLLPWLPARWGLDLKKIQEIIARGDIGRVFQIKRHESTFGKRTDWQTEKKFGGGYLLNWGPHMIDQPLQLTNSQVKSVYGDVKQIINPGDVEDNFVVVTKTTDGITLYSEFNICAAGQPNWVVQGDKGTIFVYDEKITVHKVTQPETLDPKRYRNPVEIKVIEERVSDDVYLLGDTCTVYKDITATLRGEKEYPVTLESVLLLNRIIDAAKLSEKTNKTILF